MHESAMIRMSWFVDNYIRGKGHVRVLDVGSYNVNGCLRPLFDELDAEYVGLDIEAGPNVDIVMQDAYNWDNVPDESFDFVISANAFEHIEYPWLTIKQIYRKLKPEGIACIHAPLNIGEHRYPIDCYRYYPDGFRALGKWGGFQVVNATVGGIPSPSAPQNWDGADDTLMIAVKSDKLIDVNNYPALNYERRVHNISENASSIVIFKALLKHTMPRTFAFLRKVKKIITHSAEEA